MSSKLLLFLIVFSVACIETMAQHSSQKCRWEKLVSREFDLDSLSVDASSIVIEGISDSLYHYNINTRKLVFGQSVGKDSVYICYRVLPYRFNKTFYKRSLAVYDSNAIFKDPPPSLNSTPKEELFHSPELSKTGSLSRGISFGNTQNVFVNSALNLQLDGKISDDINIRAVISDQNIPVQPEGNTQQLQEFDKVYIQLYNENASLTAGDVVLQNKESQFLRYYKNVQGGQAEANYKIGNHTSASTSASASIAKGKFASTNVPIMEGVSGPYRLRGAENERFIIVLANSERVFLDGVLLQRGFDYDYVIDYNLGELTFTPKVVITRYSRIRVDFEYAERNYSRSIVNANHYQKTGKVNLFLNLYTEKDNPRQPLTFGLSNEQINNLSQIGDNLDLAHISAYDSVPFSNNRILYKKENIDLQGQVYSVFTYSAHPDSARYSVIFLEVGEGKGNYNQVGMNATGRIYQFVPPVNGHPQGRFEPIRQIPLPNKKQMFTAGAGFEISSHDKIFAEVALSEHDLNLYSNLDNHDDQGTAFKTGYQMSGRKLRFLKGYKLNALFDYEFNNQNFRPIDRFRYIEFDRDWAFDPLAEEKPANDHIVNWAAIIEKDTRNRVEYKLSTRNRGEEVNGFQHFINAAHQMGRFQLSSRNFIMNNNKSLNRASWFRSLNDVHYNSGVFVPGYEFHLDKNKEIAHESGKIMKTAMNFHEHKAYIRSNDSLETRFSLSHSYRIDNDTLNNQFLPSTVANTTSFNFATEIKDNHNLNLILTYRNLENQEAFEFRQSKNEETVMGRVDWLGSLFDKHIRSELTYAVNNGRELKREFIYLQVPTGEGTHTWRDDNGDKVQDLNEFYEAINPDERNYVRIFVPTDEYILAFSNNFNYRLNIDMPRAWKNAGGVKSFISRFSNSTYWTIDKKITDKRFSNRIIPFNTSVEEEHLLSVRENFRSSLFYNRANPKFGWDGGLLYAQNKQLLTGGFETHLSSEYRMNTRYNIQKIYNLNLLTLTSLRSSNSDFLEGRNFVIRANKVAPEVAWQPTTHFRITGSYMFTEKKNIFSPETDERANFDEYSVDVRLTKASSATFNAVLRYINIDFEGQANTPIGYALLDALQPGNNLVWSLNLQQRLASGLQMTINYEGRKSGEVNMIHIGRMQVSALF